MPFNIDLKNTLPKITKRDVNRGYFPRYFAAKANQINHEVFEITRRDYEYLRESRYIITGHLNWVIKGPLEDREVWFYTGNPTYDMGGKEPINLPGVLTQNRGAVRFLSKRIPILGNHLTNYQEFYVGD